MLEIFETLSFAQWTVLIISALLIGINKTAIPGLGVLPVVMLTLIFEPRMSTGVQLGMLALADLVAVAYYRKQADWHILLRLLPWALGGIALGSLILHFVPMDGTDMKRMIGLIVLLLLILSFIRKHLAPEKIPSGIVWSGFYGVLLGSTTQLANAAGPVSSIYFLAMKLPKEKYLGCCAWFFLILNWIKLPVFAVEGRVTLSSIYMDICMLPFLISGGVLGIVLLKKLPQKIFEAVVQSLVLIASLRLLWG